MTDNNNDKTVEISLEKLSPLDEFKSWIKANKNYPQNSLSKFFPLLHGTKEL